MTAALTETAPLFHYTCRHAMNKIGDQGLLIPVPHPFIGAALTWFTDSDSPDPQITGLTSTTLSCDRTTWRYIPIDTTEIVPWIGSRWHSSTPPRAQAVLHRWGDPSRWFVTDQPTSVLLDAAFRRRSA